MTTTFSQLAKRLQGFPFRKAATAMAALLLGIALAQTGWYLAERSRKPEPLPAEKINLALRRTADLLFTEAGDRTSRIPPVEQASDRVWRVRMERAFSYDRLPALLEASFAVHHITRDYDVAVLNCRSGTLLLGYNFLDFHQRGTVACMGRDLPQDCYHLQVTFAPGAVPPQPLPLSGWLLGGLIGIAFYGAGQRRKPVAEPAPPAASTETAWLTFGQSRLDAGNLQLVCRETPHKLTYREAKLLHLFARHPNQVLERSFILDNVWGDEGIVVGRSVDMFVSRLRKLLRDDSSVQLVAVHGVGYRMEVG